jgi:hypothetical protein
MSGTRFNPMDARSYHCPNTRRERANSQPHLAKYS